MKKFTNRARVATMVAACGLIPAVASAQTFFYQENFDSAVRNQQSGDPRITAACGTGNSGVFTHTFPTGWVNDLCTVPTFACRVGPVNCPGTTCSSTCNGVSDGFREYEGWAVVDKAWWVTQQGGQGRENFAKGLGKVAIADPDGWDDKGNPDENCGLFNSFVKTSSINLTTADLSTLSFTFDSCWQYEGFDDGPAVNNQTATIDAIFTVGGSEVRVAVLKWDSDDGVNSGNGMPSAFFKPDNTNETVTINLNGNALYGNNLGPAVVVPAGATAVRFEFGLTLAENDWYWGVDNLRLAATVGGVADSTVFAENFEGVTLLPPVDSRPTGCSLTYCNVNTFTHIGPNGSVVTVNNGVTGGVPDWFGWSFVDRAFWRCAASDASTDPNANGVGFTNASGIIAVADGDEYADLARTPGTPGGSTDLDTLLATPSFNIATRRGNLLVLSFASSWRWEAGQTAILTADYTLAGGSTQTVEVFRWESDELSPNFKPDAVNEVFTTLLRVPSGATNLKLNFRYIAGNNWWWAIDNVAVFEGQATVLAGSAAPSRTTMALAPSIDNPACSTPWSPSLPTGWDDQWLPSSCSPCGRPEWQGWSVSDKEWWIQVEGNQRRSEFTKGLGYVMVADNDAWDDQPNGQAKFNAFGTTPSIALSGAPSSLSLAFDSSWRPESYDDTCSCDVTANIVSVSTGTAPVVTTSIPHGLSNGHRVTIANSDAVPSVNGAYWAVVLSPTTFTFAAPAEVTVAGTAIGTSRGLSNNQTGTVTAIYTVAGSPVRQEVLRFDSLNPASSIGTQPNAPSTLFFKNDSSTNDSIAINLTGGNAIWGSANLGPALSVPAGATAVRFEFGMTEARNDWFWAIDNVNVSLNGATVLAENFENVPNLQPAATENPPTAACIYFSGISAQPGNLTVDNTGLSAQCDSVPDFKGFNAWATTAWAAALGGNRQLFTPALSYISDFSASATGCTGIARLVTPNYSIANFNANSVKLTFTSSWLSQPNHDSSIEASYNGGMTWVPVLSWNPSNKTSNFNETVVVDINNPVGNTIRLRFNDANSGWWAIGGWSVTGTVGQNCIPDYNGDGILNVNDIFDFLNGWFSNNTQADTNQDGVLNVQDIFDFLAAWFAGC
jgi:hypothetical protein